MAKRRRFTAKFKAEVVLEALGTEHLYLKPMQTPASVR